MKRQQTRPQAPALRTWAPAGLLSPGWNRPWLAGLLLVAATLLAYQPAWHGGFIWDDDCYVTDNRLLSAPDGLKQIWFSLNSPSQYFPLVYTALRFERALWGLNPTGYHWVNLLLHTANALLVWRLLRRLGVPGAWLAGALFALHPVQVESVAWITEQKNVLSLFFSLLAMRAWVEFVEGPAARAWWFYALAVLSYGLALLSKSTACTLPAALLLVLWLKGRPIGWRRLAQVVPFVVLGLGMGLLAVWWERYHQGTQGRLFSLGLLERLLVASRAVWFYTGKLLWPAHLTFSYPRWTIDSAAPLAYGWLVAGAGVCAAICLGRRRLGRGVEVAVLYYIATLCPLLGWIMLYTFLYSFVADHYQYAASIGPLALAAAGISLALNRLGQGRGAGAALCAVLLASLSLLTWRQSDTYRDSETLWRRTLARNPGSYLAHNNLAAVCLQKGLAEEALANYQEAIELHPDWAEAHYNLGTALLRIGRLDEAPAQFQAALELQPDYVLACNNLGNLFLQKGQIDKALAQYEKILELQPDSAVAHNNLGSVLLRKGRVEEAIAQFQKALDSQPGMAEAHCNLGIAFLGWERLDEAAAHFQRALALKPDYAKARDYLGGVLSRQGQADGASTSVQSARPPNPARRTPPPMP